MAFLDDAISAFFTIKKKGGGNIYKILFQSYKSVRI